MGIKQVTHNIALTPRLDQFLKRKVKSGRYQSASEVVSESLRLLEAQDQVLKKAASLAQQQIEEGWQQSVDGNVVNGPAVFTEIRRMSKAKRAANSVLKR